MSLKTFIYIKKQNLSRYLAFKFARNRLFTTMQLMLKTLQSNKMLPEKLVALEVFGFIGTSTAMDYAHLTEYLELWELNPLYAREAKKNLPNANVVCGDSIHALKNGKLHRKEYNFIVIDPNSMSSFDDGSYESFGVFSNALNYIAAETVLFVTIYSDLKNYANLYGITVSQLDEGWIRSRKEFFEMENVINGRGIDYLNGFEKIIKQKNIDLVYSQFISRNDCVGFGVFVVKKKV